ncbi:hypothetical protein D2T29_00570 [Sinirhodobacter populi]|uniref:Uncharacterized protein n=1 Tax=Paenirhodobacter populi TaxID=2306993 RepID=A0A443KPV3_9RHOB|nr:hypothetical protein [Sinirhodobacter populi]RWR35005.1 hypothetical protein D2T29_00570 [Sinirhodobacter populi]
MTSMHDCIQRAVDAGGLNPQHGRAAQAAYAQLVDRYSTIMSPAQAQAAAAQTLQEVTRKAARSRAHKVLNELQAAKRIMNQINTADDPGRAIRDMIEGHTREGYQGESVRGLMEAYTDSINAGLAEVLQKHGLNVAGSVRDRAGFENLIRELHGQSTGDASAHGLADAVRYQQKRMRQLFNAHGGDVGEIADYGVPHAHSAEMLIKHGFDQWARDITPLLDWNRMIDLRTGQPFAAAPGGMPNPADAQRILRDVYDGITTRGWDDRTPSQQAGGTALYNQRADHRVLHFSDGDAWLNYNRTYGAADPFSAMMNGLHGLARDVAMMRVLGPNPRGGLELATQAAMKRAQVAGDPKMAQRVQAQAKLAKVMLGAIDGSNNVPEHAGMAAFFSGTRAVLSSIQLGSAVVSSVTDAATMRVAAKAIGLNPSNVMTRTMSLTMSGLSRREAARLGYVAQTLGEAGGGSARYFGDLLGSGLPSRLSGFTLRASGLNFITDMRRLAFQMETSAKMASQADRPFAQIEPNLRRMLEKRGITSADWDLLRDPAVRFTAQDGSDFISAQWFLEHQTALPRMEAEGLAMRLQMAIREELEYALPSMSVEGRARMQGDTKPGSFPGELLRSSMSYKGYPLSVMLSQYRRFLQQPTPMAKAAYAANILIPLTLLGGVAVQLKEIVKGNDPRPMDEPKFWMAATFQGGGLGIFGDFFAAEASRAGGGLGETLAGPVVGLAGDAIRLGAAPVQAAVEGKPMNWGRAVARFQRNNTPVASSMWYVRTAFSRIVSDNIQRFLDPEAEDDFRRRARQQQKDYGSDAWWGLGRSAPDRAPDLSNVLGDPR